MGEVIMQLLGSYFLGKTAHVGVDRGFYLNSHLSPFWRGMQARNMYIGAMFWLVAGFAVVIMWIVVVIWHAAIMHFFTTTKSWAKHFAATTIPVDKQPKRMKNWRRSEQPVRRRRSHRIPETNESGILISEAGGHTMRGGAGSPETYNSGGIFRGSDGSAPTSGPSSTSAFDGLPMRPQDFPQAAAPSGSQGNYLGTQRNGYQPVTVIPEMVQMRAADFPVQLHSGYQDAQTPTYGDQHFRVRSPLATAHPHNDSMYIHRGNPPLDPFRDTRYHSVNEEDIEEEDEQRARHPQWDPNDHVPKNFRDWQPYLLGLGIFLGFVSYIAQWLFWAGFVNASGDRFCPPNLASMGTLWSIAAIFGLGTSFGLQ
jgi:hypothetical protein